MRIETLIFVSATAAVVVVLFLLLALVLARGNWNRLKTALAAGFRILADAEFAERASELLAPQEGPQLDPAPIRLLGILQREGRLVDFLMEDISSATDERIAAGVREIHQKCRHALTEHLKLEPVLSGTEGENIEVPPGFDPSAIQLTGNVSGEPPFRGILQHAGWRVTEIRISPAPEGVDELVVQPAEVELP